jgi:hypothetical protein
MIEVLEKIPKIYERAVLAEYYRFFQNLNGSKDIINKNLSFTTDAYKLTEKETRNECFLEAYKVLENNQRNIKFVLLKGEEQELLAVARIRIDEFAIYICDIVYTNYPTIAEQISSFTDLYEAIKDIANNYQKDYLEIEVPKNDDFTLDEAEYYGFANTTEPNRVTRNYKTVILTKEIRKKELNGQTRSRKQTK